MSTWINTFITTVKNSTGIEPMVYANNDYVTTYMNSSVTTHNLWISRWSNAYGDPTTTGSPPTGVWGTASKPWSFWQYSNTGTVSGVSGSVDLDSFNGTAAQFQGYIIGPQVVTPSQFVNPVTLGGNFQIRLASFTDYNSNSFTATVDWGDGSAPISGIVTKTSAAGVTPTTGDVAAKYQYAQSGTYAVKVTVTDGNGAASVMTESLKVDSSPAAYLIPGAIGSQTNVQFTLTSLPADATYTNQLGVYVVDDAAHSIGNLHPDGTPSFNYAAYTQAALSATTSFQPLIGGANQGSLQHPYTFRLDAGQYVGFYLVQNSTTATYLSATTNKPNVFFLNPKANFDGTIHVRPPSNGQQEGIYSFEDQTAGGDEDFNDLVFSLGSTPATTVRAAAIESASRIDLDWDAFPGAAGYRIYRGTSPTNLTRLGSDQAATAITLSDSTAVRGTTYYYAVAALDASGNESSRSALASASLAIPAPTLTAAANTAQQRIELNWNDVQGEHGFYVYKGTSQTSLTRINSSLPVGRTYFFDTSATVGTAYYYKVVPIDGGGTEAALSNVASATLQQASPLITGSPATSFATTIPGAEDPKTIYLDATVRDFNRSSSTDVNDFNATQFDNGGQRSQTLWPSSAVAADLGSDHTPNLSTTNWTSGDWYIHGPQTFAQWFHGNDANRTTHLVMPLQISMGGTDGKMPIYTYHSTYGGFLPINGRLLTAPEGHNGFFTFESHSTFTYRANEAAPMSLNFSGDDDVWIYINNRLAVDDSGIHPPVAKHVTLDSATISQLGLGLSDGQTYPIDIFFAERDGGGSTFELDTSIPIASEKEYTAVLTASELKTVAGTEDEDPHTEPANLTWHIDQPSNATITPIAGTSPLTSVIRWVPTASDLGHSTHFKASVTDDLNQTTTKEWDVQVASELNRSPIKRADAPAPPSSIIAGHTLTWSAASSFTDPDGDPLKFYALADPALPDGMTLAEDGSFHWTPTVSQLYGKSVVTVNYAVSDGRGGIIQDHFDLNASMGVPVITMDADASHVAENSNGTYFTIHSDRSVDQDLPIHYSISGTATNGTDYQVLSGTLTLGQMEDEEFISLLPIDDHLHEPNETVTVTLTPDAGYYIPQTQASVTVAIDDNDPLPHIGAYEYPNHGVVEGTVDDPNCAVLLDNVTGSGPFTYHLRNHDQPTLDPVDASTADNLIPESWIDDGDATASTVAHIDAWVSDAYGTPSDALHLSVPVTNKRPGVIVHTPSTNPMAGDSVTLGTTVQDDSHADQAGVFTYAWTMFYKLEGESGSVSVPVDLSGVLTDQPTLTFTPDQPGQYAVFVDVTDKDGGLTTSEGTVDVDAPSVSITASDANASVPELKPNDIGSYTLYRTGLLTNDLQVTFVINDPDNASGENRFSLSPDNYTATFSAGNATTSIVLSGISGLTPRGNENITVSLLPSMDNSYSLNVANASATVTLHDQLITPVSNVQVTTSTDLTSARLDWNIDADAMSYNVYRSTDELFVPDISNQIATSLVTPTFSDDTAASDIRYYYVVTGMTPDGESAASDIAENIIQQDAQPTNLTTHIVDENTVEFAWDDQSSNESGFQITIRNTADDSIVSQEVLPADATSYFATDLTEDSQYSIDVQALHQTNNMPASAPTTPVGIHQYFATPEAGAYVGLIIVVDGHFGKVADPSGPMSSLLGLAPNQSDPSNLGLTGLTVPGTNLHYRVIEAAEDFVQNQFEPGVSWDGKGYVYQWALNLLSKNSIRDVAVVGFSHGGSVAIRLSNNLQEARNPIQDLWRVRYAALIDPIFRLPIDNVVPAWPDNTTCLADTVTNFYNVAPWTPFGNPFKSAPSSTATSNLAINAVHQKMPRQTAVIHKVEDDIQMIFIHQ